LGIVLTLNLVNASYPVSSWRIREDTVLKTPSAKTLIYDIVHQEDK